MTASREEKMLSISRLLLIVLCVNAYSSAAADAKFPSRFDMQLVNLQSLDAGDSFSYEALTNMGLSISPAADGLDVYTFSFDEAVVSANQLPTTTMGVTDRLSYTFRRDPKSQEIFSNDIDADAIRQVNAYFAALGGAQTRTGRWTERARIFSPAYIDLPGENPNVAFDVRSASHDGSEIKIATYGSEQFSFRTTVGQTVRARFVGYTIAADDWRVPLASGFALVGDIEETDGGRIPLAMRKKTLSVHPVTRREYLDPARYIDAGLARQIDVESVFDADSKPLQAPPSWLSNIHTVFLHANALSGAMAEGQSNPEPVTTTAAAGITAGTIVGAVGTAIAVDAIVTPLYNTAVDLVKVYKGDKKLKDVKPWDHSESWKWKGALGTLTKGIGMGVTAVSSFFGVEKKTAKKYGEVTEATLDVASIFIPSNVAGGTVRALTMTQRASDAAKIANIGKVVKVAKTGEHVNKLSRAANRVPVVKKAIKGLSAGAKRALRRSQRAAQQNAQKALPKAKEAVSVARKEALKAAAKLSTLQQRSLQLQKRAKYLRALQVAYNVNEPFDAFLDEVLSFEDAINTPDASKLSDRLVDLAADQLQKVPYDFNKIPKFISDMTGIPEDQFLKRASYEPIPAEISSMPDASRNAVFTPTPAPMSPVLPPTSTGGFTDAAIILPLRFRVFDSGNLEDGDIVRLEVRSSNGVNLGPTNVTLTFAGQTFSPAVAAGPVQVKLTAVNEGSVPPNTGGLNILSTVTRGQSNQNFSLQTGGSGSLNIVADPPPPSGPGVQTVNPNPPQ